MGRGRVRRGVTEGRLTRTARSTGWVVGQGRGGEEGEERGGGGELHLVVAGVDCSGRVMRTNSRWRAEEQQGTLYRRLVPVAIIDANASYLSNIRHFVSIYGVRHNCSDELVFVASCSWRSYLLHTTCCTYIGVRGVAKRFTCRTIVLNAHLRMFVCARRKRWRRCLAPPQSNCAPPAAISAVSMRRACVVCHAYCYD